MTSTANPTPLLDGPRRSIFLALVMLVLTLVTLDGGLTWVAAEEADDIIDKVSAARFGVDDTGLLLNSSERVTIANNSDGDRLDRDLITNKTWLAVIGLIAAVALTIAAGPGSSRNLLAAMIIVSAAAFFVPLLFYGDTIDIVTTAHGG